MSASSRIEASGCLFFFIESSHPAWIVVLRAESSPHPAAALPPALRQALQLLLGRWDRRPGPCVAILRSPAAPGGAGPAQPVLDLERPPRPSACDAAAPLLACEGEPAGERRSRSEASTNGSRTGRGTNGAGTKVPYVQRSLHTVLKHGW